MKKYLFCLCVVANQTIHAADYKSIMTFTDMDVDNSIPQEQSEIGQHRNRKRLRDCDLSIPECVKLRKSPQRLTLLTIRNQSKGMQQQLDILFKTQQMSIKDYELLSQKLSAIKTSDAQESKALQDLEDLKNVIRAKGCADQRTLQFDTYNEADDGQCIFDLSAMLSRVELDDKSLTQHVICNEIDDSQYSFDLGTVSPEAGLDDSSSAQDFSRPKNFITTQNYTTFSPSAADDI